jgi:hypothetical protein
VKDVNYPGEGDPTKQTVEVSPAAANTSRLAAISAVSGLRATLYGTAHSCTTTRVSQWLGTRLSAGDQPELPLHAE